MNHIVRNSALCTTDWCDAKKEIERLKAQVAELTQEREIIADIADASIAMKEEQLAAMTRLWENEYRLRCEAQARIVELREALKVASIALADHGTAYLNHEDEYSTACGYVSAALATHDNTDTLDRRLQEERERYIEVCVCNDCSCEIRGLK